MLPIQYLQRLRGAQTGRPSLRIFRILASLLFILAVPVALVTTNIRWVANEDRVYVYAIDQYTGVQTTGVDREDLLRGGAELREFFRNDTDTFDIRVMQNDREISLFNPRETTHLEDVKDRFQEMNAAQEFSVLYIVAYIAIVVLWAREVSVRRLAVQTALGCVVLLATVGIIGAIGLSGFDSAWTQFHEIIFSNDFWLLNPTTDRLIQMVPPEFWESIVFFIGLMIIAETALVLIAVGIYLGASGNLNRARGQFEPEYA